MATVVLIGFSTAGKSTILQHFKDVLGTLVEVVDSDKKISEDYGGHIYLLYNELVKGKDRNEALNYIRCKENEILRKIKPDKNPRLIAFGPLVPAREEWVQFLERVQPVAFYIELSVWEVREGLRGRHNRHVADGLKSLPAFGSWDECMTTRFDEDAQQWVLIEDEEEILKNIRDSMRNLTPLYEMASGTSNRIYSGRKLRTDVEYRQRFYEKVITALLSI